MKRTTLGFIVALLTFAVGVTATTTWLAPSFHIAESQSNPAVESPTNASRVQQAVPAGWQKIDAKGHFTFYVPPGMKAGDVRGIDSYVGAYRNAEMRVSFDYGWYSDPLNSYSKGPEYKESFVELSGRKAKLVTFIQPEVADGFRHMAAVHFEDVGVAKREGFGETKLTMRIICKHPDALETAKRVLRSIAFP